MNFFMFLATVITIVGLFGLYDSIRSIKRNGVFPSDRKLYRWFALLLLLVLPVRNFQDQLQMIKIGYYILIPVVLIWLFYVHFRDGKAYMVVDIAEDELIVKIEDCFKQHKVKLVKEKKSQGNFLYRYKLSDTEATIVVKQLKDILNDKDHYSYTLTFKKWWRLPNSEIIIEELLRKLQLERKPLRSRKRKMVAFSYGLLFLVGAYLAMNII
ncbi:MAG: hypothetical protein ACK4M9_09600 [Anaerobacillus sp.]|uniref:hypothetical protein n=1 Tax=Anaerobacillus sp. TaxID=1872506 RepID=UPI003918E79D